VIFDKTVFTAHSIFDGASIVLDSSVSAFKAAYVGVATIQAAAIATLKVLGDTKQISSANSMAPDAHRW
jgi:hypothetical protein